MKVQITKKKTKSMIPLLAVLILAGVLGAGVIPVKACEGSAHGEIIITDFDPQDDITGGQIVL